MTYSVLVGNVGEVYSGESLREARLIFATYLDHSRSNRGRCAGESVSLFIDGEIVAKHIGSIRD